eukprot:5377396-Prymnesium_polylepis.1
MLPVASVLGTDPARRRYRTRPRPAGRPPPRAPTCTQHAVVQSMPNMPCRGPPCAQQHHRNGRALSITRERIRGGSGRSLD